MRNAWVLLIALFGLIAAIAIPFLRQHRQKSRKTNTKYKAVANTSSVRDLPEYKAAERKYMLLLLAVAFLFVMVFSSVSIIASRPVSVSTARPEYENRDIMLCLDVSGSMDEYIKELLQYFSQLLDGFKGQRVGMTIFNNVHFTLSPLSDDYDALMEQIDDILENTIDYQLAVSNMNSDPSAIGSGVVGCIESFDKLGEENRSRAIILATDNDDYRKDPIITLTQAGNYAKRYDIAIYGLSTADTRSQEEIDHPGTYSYESENNKEFRETVLATGGAYYAFSKYGSNDISVKKIVDQILEQAAARYEGTETLIRTDSPLIPTIIAVICAIALVIIVWRLSI